MKGVKAIGRGGCNAVGSSLRHQRKGDISSGPPAPLYYLTNDYNIAREVWLL